MTTKKNMPILATDANSAQKVLMQKADFLYKTGQPFKVIKSGGSYQLTSKVWNTAGRKSDSMFEPKDMNFIKSVKYYVEKNNIDLKFIDKIYSAKDVRYIDVNPKFINGEVISDVVCIDIINAYWQTAYMLEIISEDVYRKGLTFNKIVRLASLGSLAKQTITWEFDGKKMVNHKPKLNPHQNLWYSISKRVSDVMMEARKVVGKDFIFYWVDGIYIPNKPELITKVNAVFLKYGYKSLMESIIKIEFNKMDFKVYPLDAPADKDHKQFSWMVGSGEKDRGKNQPITKWIEDKRLLKIANEIIYGKKKSK